MADSGLSRMSHFRGFNERKKSLTNSSWGSSSAMSRFMYSLIDGQYCCCGVLAITKDCLSLSRFNIHKILLFLVSLA